jgi:hypothetical protein
VIKKCYAEPILPRNLHLLSFLSFVVVVVVVVDFFEEWLKTNLRKNAFSSPKAFILHVHLTDTFLVLRFISFFISFPSSQFVIFS